MFSVASALLIRPLPFDDPSRLVWIQNGDAPGLSAQTAQVNPYLSLARENRSFSEIGAYFAFYGVGDMTLSSPTDAIRISAVPGDAEFLFAARRAANDRARLYRSRRALGTDRKWR